MKGKKTLGITITILSIFVVALVCYAAYNHKEISTQLIFARHTLTRSAPNWTVVPPATAVVPTSQEEKRQHWAVASGATTLQNMEPMRAKRTC